MVILQLKILLVTRPFVKATSVESVLMVFAGVVKDGLEKMRFTATIAIALMVSFIIAINYVPTWALECSKSIKNLFIVVAL